MKPELEKTFKEIEAQQQRFFDGLITGEELEKLIQEISNKYFYLKKDLTNIKSVDIV